MKFYLDPFQLLSSPFRIVFSPWLSGPWSLVICHFYYLVICSNGFQPNSATRPSLQSPSLTCTLSVWKYLLFGENTKRMGSVIAVDHDTKTIKQPLNPSKRSWPQLKRACSGNTSNTNSGNTRNTNSGNTRNTNSGNARYTNSKRHKYKIQNRKIQTPRDHYPN